MRSWFCVTYVISLLYLVKIFVIKKAYLFKIFGLTFVLSSIGRGPKGRGEIFDPYFWLEKLDFHLD